MNKLIKLPFLITLTYVIAVCSLASGEEPFCNNRCRISGITTSKICYCDLLCASVFNDCCGDSEQLLNKYGQFSFNRETAMKCKRMTDNGISVMVVDKCSPDWKGNDVIRDSCMLRANSTADPMMSVPVTNVLTGTTYSNYRCAMCNGWAKTHVFWKIKVSCPTLNHNLMELDQENVLKYIFYNHGAGQWGMSVIDDISSREVFHACDVSYAIPRTLQSKVRRCDSELVSTCSSTWKEDLMKRMCNRYIDPVYGAAEQVHYRNLYCAICNRVDISSLSCGQAMGPRHHGFPGRVDDGANFALLLDVDISDGNIVGKKSVNANCRKGEVFDPFVKTCRNIVCVIPGYTLKDGKCAPISNNKEF